MKTRGTRGEQLYNGWMGASWLKRVLKKRGERGNRPRRGEMLFVKPVNVKYRVATEERKDSQRRESG